MSPEEWAKKIADLIIEAEADLYRGREFYLARPDSMTWGLQKYVDGIPQPDEIVSFYL